MSNGSGALDTWLRSVTGIDFWATGEGRLFYAELSQRVGVPVARNVTVEWGYFVEPEEITDELVLLLTPGIGGEQVSRISTAVCDAANGWAYLASCAKQVAQKMAGHRGTSLEKAAELSAMNASPEGQGALGNLPEAIRMTVQLLAKESSAINLECLRLAVTYLALNPEQHRGHGHTEVTVNPDLRAMGVTPWQARALANVCWGIRGRQVQTSLLLGFLVDDRFDPWSSPGTVRALRDYRRDICMPRRLWDTA